MYYKLNKILSYCFAIMLFIGARGRGKTYSIKSLFFKDFKYKGKMFIVIRDTIAAIDELKKDNGFKFLNDIMDKPCFKKDKARIEGDSIYFNDKLAGYLIPLSAYYKYKGNAYSKVKNILFDEFIPEKQQSYNGSKARQFLNTIETIGRLRTDLRVFLTANAIDAGNEILELFGFIGIKSGMFGIFKNKEKNAILHYIPNNKQFDEAKQKSIAGSMAKGSRFEDSLTLNKFEGDAFEIYEKRKPCSLYGIYYNGEGDAIRIYEAKDGSEYYASKDINNNSYNYMRYVFTLDQVASNRQFATKETRDYLTSLYINKILKFESNYILKVFQSLINNRKGVK